MPRLDDWSTSEAMAAEHERNVHEGGSRLDPFDDYSPGDGDP